MTTIGYFMSITSFQKDVGLTLTILNIAGRGPFLGVSNGNVDTEFWIIPNCNKNMQQDIMKLQAIPAIRSISVTPLSYPVKPFELAEVRDQWAQMGWNTSDVDDKALTEFINDKLQGKYTYYIDHEQGEERSVKIRTKPIEEHPQFSPDWLSAADYNVNEAQHNDIKLEDLEIRVHVFESEQEDELQIPPDTKQ